MIYLKMLPLLASLPFALFAAKTAAPHLPIGELPPTSAGGIFR